MVVGVVLREAFFCACVCGLECICNDSVAAFSPLYAAADYAAPTPCVASTAAEKVAYHSLACTLACLEFAAEHQVIRAARHFSQHTP